MTGRPILTSAEMRAAEARAVEAGTTYEQLMERAGTAAAEAIWRFAGPTPALVLCGPGNNGGDGYVIARLLAERGAAVTVAACGEPLTPAATAARKGWRGEIVALDQARPAPLLVDALFGTGLKRGLSEDAAGVLSRMAGAARLRVAIDLPSGVAADDGAVLSPVPDFDLTITFASLKPGHLLQPSARHMGRLVVADIGAAADSMLVEVSRPKLRAPGPEDHKYTRGLVTVVAGDMPGAAMLAATAAARAGAGAVRLQAERVLSDIPAAIVQTGAGPLERLDDERIGCLLIGCGLANDANGRKLFDAAAASQHPLLLDAGALSLLAESGFDRLQGISHLPILTPHEGEFARLFGKGQGSKIDRSRDAAARAQAVIVYKGRDTVIAHPDLRAAIHASHSSWLATGGSGDALAGIIAAMRAGGLDAFEAACAGVWLHARAADLAGPALIADDLASQLPLALAECLPASDRR